MNDNAGDKTVENIVNFPGKKDKPAPEDTSRADEALEIAGGRFEDVIIVGLSRDNAQLISTIELSDTIYELSRAIYKLHGAIDQLFDGD